MTTVALLGSTGFVGGAVRVALERRGATVLSVSSPRLKTRARDLGGVMADVEANLPDPTIRALAAVLVSCDAVVNAAGLAEATGEGDRIFGANALLPALLVAVAPSGARVIHVSSAAVQGRREVLDESESVSPFSPYSSSKALGEAAVWAVRPDAVCYRPTSVHGEGRELTRSLARILASPFATVAGAGKAPTPQVQVENVGDAVAFLATTHETPPRVVLHPSEGLTSAELTRILGGREPTHVPMWLARSVVAVAFWLSRAAPSSSGIVRRLEMLWFGQRQDASWLSNRWSPVKDIDSWRELA